MKSFITICVLTSSAIALAACGHSDSSAPPQQPSSAQVPTQQTPTTTPPNGDPSHATSANASMNASANSTTPAPAPATPQPPPLSDADIVAITSAANNGEIEMAKVAQKSGQNAQVKSFAAMMIKDHGEAEAKGKKIAQAAKITPSENEHSTKLKSEGEATITSLKAQKGAELDKAYMESQVKAHKDVLAMLDDKLIPNAKAPELKTHLTEVRGHVAMHLTKAQDISGALSGQASTTTPATKK